MSVPPPAGRNRRWANYPPGRPTRSRRRRSAGGTAGAAVGSLGFIGGPAVVWALAAALSDDSDDLVVAAANALGATGETAAESPLIAALDRDGPNVWPAVPA